MARVDRLARGAVARLMDAPAKIPSRILRLWGAQTGGILLLVGSAVVFWRGKDWGYIPLALGGAIAILGLTCLPPARIAYRAWHAMIGFVLLVWTRLALLLTFLIAVTPLALVGRLIGRDRMGLRFPGRAESYWKERRDDPSPDRYRRQF